MTRQTLRSIRGSFLRVAAAALGAVACAPDATLAPAPAASASRFRTLPTQSAVIAESAQMPARLAQCTRREALVGSAVFGPSGGTLVMGNNQLIIPAGALTAETLVTATIPEGDVAAIRLEPAGLRFRKPAGLILDVGGCDLSGAAIPNVVYVDEAGAILDFIEAVFSNYWHTIAAPIDHFSQYAVAV